MIGVGVSFSVFVKMAGRGRPPKKGPMSEYMLKKHGLWKEPDPEYDEDGNVIPRANKCRPKMTEEEKEERRRQREEEKRLHPERFLKPKGVNPDFVVHTSRRQQLLLEQQKEREEKERKEQEMRDGNGGGIGVSLIEEEEEEERPVPMTEKEVEEEKVFGTVAASAAAKKETKKPKYYDEELEKGIGEDLVKIKKRWSRGRKEERLERQLTVKATSSSEMVTAGEGGEDDESKSPKGLALAKRPSLIRNHPESMISSAYAETAARVNEDENVQLGMLLAPHSTLTSLSRAYKLSPMTLKQLHEGLVKREPNAVVDEVHAALLRVLATDVLEADAYYGGGQLVDVEDKKVFSKTGSTKVIVLDDGSTIPRSSLDFDECFKYLDIVTWPAYAKKLVERLRARGNRHVPKCNWADHRYGGYYGATVYEKIELLQFLVDETLDTNVIRNELETREVLIEAGEFQVANGGLLTSKIGALVEVYGMEHPIRGSWYSGVVIAAAGDRIRVRYDELLSDVSNHKLEEWVTLEDVRSHDWKLRRKKLTSKKLDPASVMRIAQLARKKNRGRSKRAKKKRVQSNRADDDRDAFPRVRPLNPYRMDKKSRAQWIRSAGDVVECYQGGGWWCGRITNPIGALGRMEVQFPGENESKLIKKEDVDTMLTWDGDEWYIAGTDDVVEKNASAVKSLEQALAAAADTHGDMCSVCGRSGSLVCCDGCPSAFHAVCAGEPTNRALAETEWFCPECVAVPEQIRSDKELRAQAFPFLRTECALCETDGDALGRKYFFSAKDGVAKLEGGMNPKKFGSGRADLNAAIRENEWKRFEVLAIDRKPFEEANAYLDDIRNASEDAKASLKRGQQVTEVGADPIQVFEKFGLGDCGKTLPEWEKDKIVGPTYAESEEEEEDIDEMEFDGEDSGEEEEHDDEKWSDLDNDEREAPPSSARGGKRKRGGRKEPEEEEEVMPTSGRSRRANAGKKTETYSPTKVAEEQRARQEAMQPKVVVKEEPIPFNDPEMERALEERRKLALSHAAKIEYESSLLAVAPAEANVEKVGGDTPTAAPSTPLAATMGTKTTTESCYTYQNKYANAGVFALANATGETARGRVTSLFVNQWFAPYPIPQPPIKPGWQDHLAKDKLGHVVAKACHMERYLCGLLDGPWAGTETVTGDQWRQKWLTSLRGSSTFKDVAKWILLLESSIRPLAMKAAWYAQEIKENASIFEFEKKEQEHRVEKVGPSSLRSEVAPLALVLRGKRVPIKSLRKCARNGGVKSILPERVVNYRIGWRGRGLPQPSRLMRAAWIAEVENASSAAYLGLLLRFFDHHIAWDHIKSPMFHKIHSNSFDGRHKNINFRQLEIVEKRFAKWPTTGAVLAQYRLEPVPKVGGDDSKKNSPSKASPTKVEEGEKDSARPMEEDKKMPDAEEALAPPAAEEKKEVEKIPAPPAEENTEVEKIPVPPAEEKMEVENVPVPPAEEKMEVENVPVPPAEEKMEVEKVPASPAEENTEVENVPVPQAEENTEVEKAPAPPAEEKKAVEEAPAAEKMEMEEVPPEAGELRGQEAVPLTEKQPSPVKTEGAEASVLGDGVQEQGNNLPAALAAAVAAAPAGVTIHDPLSAATAITVPPTSDEKNETKEEEKKEEEPVPIWINDTDCPLFLMNIYETKIRGWTRAEEKNLGFNPGFTPGRQSVTIPITYEDIGTHLAGCKVEVLWEDDEVWYRGEIVKCCEDREFGDEYAQREKAAVDDDDGPDKDNEDAFSNKVEIQYETGELESMDIEDFKDIISKGSIRARGSIPARRGKKKASKKSESTAGESKTHTGGRVSLLPTLPDMERAEPGTFYATAHLELPRDVLERMVFEKTGKDYSLWQNPKVARWKLALMLDEGALRQAIADEKIKPTHVEKKKTGTYYVKKAERLAMEKEYKELAKRKLEGEGDAVQSPKEGQQQQHDQNNQNEGGDGSDLQPKTIRFVMSTKKEGTTEGGVESEAQAHIIAMEEKARIQEASISAMEHLTNSPVPDSANSFTDVIAQRCVYAIDAIRNVKTTQTPPSKKGLLACTYIMKELDAISKKCKDKGFKNVAEFVKVMEELFDQTSVDNTEFWEDIDFSVRPEFRKAAILIATPKPDQAAIDKFQNDTWTQLEFEKGENFGEKLVNKRVIVCWDDGEWYTANVLKYDPKENKHTLKYKDEDETETVLLNKKPGRMSPDIPDVSFPWVFASHDMLKPIDLTEATSCLSVCQYMDKCEQKGERLIEYFYRLPEKSEMPEYYENVPNPIDLVTIISRTIGGYYKYLEDFVDDVELMLENALNFNAPGTDANNDAKVLARLYRQKMQRSYVNYAPPPKPMPRGSEEEQDGGSAKKKRTFNYDNESSANKIKKLRSAASTAEERNAKSTKTPPKNSASGGHQREALSEEELKKSGLHLKKTSWNATARCGKCRTCLNRSLKKRCMNNPK